MSHHKGHYGFVQEEQSNSSVALMHGAYREQQYSVQAVASSREKPVAKIKDARGRVARIFVRGELIFAKDINTFAKLLEVLFSFFTKKISIPKFFDKLLELL